MEDHPKPKNEPTGNLPESISRQIVENETAKPVADIQAPKKPISEVLSVSQKQKLKDPALEATNKEDAKKTEAKKVDLNKPKKSIATTFVIFLAVLVMAGLSAVAVYGYTVSKKDKTSNQNKTIENSNNSSNQNPVSSTEDSDKKNLEQAVSDIDKLPSDSDDSGENISDQDVGL